jgi:hypothetical protein
MQIFTASIQDPSEYELNIVLQNRSTQVIHIKITVTALFKSYFTHETPLWQLLHAVNFILLAVPVIFSFTSNSLSGQLKGGG